MNDTISCPDFLKRSFYIGQCKYQVLLTMELNPITCKPTGVFVGTFLSTATGTTNFKLHKDKIGKAADLDLKNPSLTAALYKMIPSTAATEASELADAPPCTGDDNLIYNFVMEEFIFRDGTYKVAIIQECFAGSAALQLTGNLCITLQTPEEGTKQFQLVRDEQGSFTVGDNRRGIDVKLIIEIVAIFNKNKVG